MTATKTVGFVLHCKPDDIDSITQYLEGKYKADLVCIKQSWGKLWIMEGSSKDVQ